MGNNVIRYSSRTFEEIKIDLISLIKETYPEVLTDFSDSSVGSMLIDINAGVNNNLAMNTDRVYQETVLAYAQQRSSLLDKAKNMGFNIPNKRPSITLVDFSVQVPNLNDRPNPAYLPVLSAGAQVIGGGKTFETHDVIDFSQTNSEYITNNIKIVPNMNSNGDNMGYTITKRDVVINGKSIIYKRSINSNDVYPFFSITLPDADVIEIESIILLDNNIQLIPSSPEFDDLSNKYFEVDYLAQQSVFVNKTPKTNFTGTDNVRSAEWIDVTKKFIKEFTVNGYCKITFGSGDSNKNMFKDGLLKGGVTNSHFLNNFLNNTALGEKLKPNTTLYVKYRVGGGSNSNIGTNLLTQLGNFIINVNGEDENINQAVKRSLKVTNVIPAIGGNDGLSNEEIRNLVKFNFSGQNRCVTLTDYLIQVYKMDGKFGSPFRANVHKENNKIIVSILGIGSDGKLSNTSNSILTENIAEYLSKYRMTNDSVEIKNGRIINLSFEIKLYVENTSNSQIANNVIKIVSDYFNVNNQEMNQDIFLGKLEREIMAANGVINILSSKAFNMIGGQYSNNVISQTIDPITKEIAVIHNTLYSDGDSMFEIKYPDKDIKIILVKKIE